MESGCIYFPVEVSFVGHNPSKDLCFFLLFVCVNLDNVL